MDTLNIAIVTLLPTGIDINHNVVVVVGRARAYTLAFSPSLPTSYFACSFATVSLTLKQEEGAP